MTLGSCWHFWNIYVKYNFINVDKFIMTQFLNKYYHNIQTHSVAKQSLTVNFKEICVTIYNIIFKGALHVLLEHISCFNRYSICNAYWTMANEFWYNLHACMYLWFIHLQPLGQASDLYLKFIPFFASLYLFIGWCEYYERIALVRSLPQAEKLIRLLRKTRAPSR